MKYHLYRDQAGQFYIIETGKTISDSEMPREVDLIGGSDNLFELSIFVKTISVLFFSTPVGENTSLVVIRSLWETWEANPKRHIFEKGDF